MIPFLIAVIVLLFVVAAVFSLLRSKRRSSNRRNGPLVQTGIKAIDLFLPIPVGADVLLSGDAIAGTRVFLFLDAAIGDLECWANDLQETLPKFPEIYIVADVTTAELKKHLIGEAMDANDVVFAVTSHARFLTTFRHRFERCERHPMPSIPSQHSWSQLIFRPRNLTSKLSVRC